MRFTQRATVDGRAGGDVSSAVPARHHGGFRPFAVDLRWSGETDSLPADATRGLRDFSDDLIQPTPACGPVITSGGAGRP